MWIKSADNEKFVKKKINYVQGLFKIFDEVLVNAADSHSRNSKTNEIRVSID